MLDVFFLIAFAALPLAMWWVSRSVVFLTVGLVVGFGLAGNLVQTLIAAGVSWNVRGLQFLVLIVMVALLAASWKIRGSTAGSLRSQFLGVGLPALAIGVILVALRLAAPEDPGALSAIGYFINHPLAEDNAKWLHLSAQVADGRAISFNGYAGGPLLLMMATFSPLISVLSMALLGGVNQVAVAANTVLAVQFFLIAAVPFALAPFTSWRNRVGVFSGVPMPLLWLSAVFLALASAIVTSYGHLSQQFTFIILVLWAAAFMTAAPRWVLLATSLAIATSVSVWVPLNVLGLVIVLTALIITIRQRWWPALAVTGVTALLTFDAIVSSIVYLFGIRISLPIAGIGGISSDEQAVTLAPTESGDLIASAHLFRAPGAAEQASAVLTVLAVVVALASAWFLAKRQGLSDPLVALSMAPIVILLGYTLAMTLADAFATGSSPNYGVTKMIFTVVVTAIAAGIPFALMSIDTEATGMSALRWAGALGVVALLTFDSLLPRALSTLSPILWKGVDTAAPVYWSAAEVRNTEDQPLELNPIACLFAPPESDEPTALPLGQESYSCTRLLLGLSGMEGEASLVGDWLLTDWQSQTQTWPQFVQAVSELDPVIQGRQVVLMNRDGGLAGLSTLSELVDRNR